MCGKLVGLPFPEIITESHYHKFHHGKGCFGVLPTGYGKSLCYACLLGVFDKLFGCTLSIVATITPLMSIMKDQVNINKHKRARVKVL